MTNVAENLEQPTDVMSFWPAGSSNPSELESQAEELKHQLNTAPIAIAELKEQAEKLPTILKQLRQLQSSAYAIESAGDSYIRSRATYALHRDTINIDSLESRLRRSEEFIEDITSRSKRNARDLREVLHSLSQTSGKITYTSEKLDKELLSLPNVAEYEVHSPQVIRVKLTNILIKPSENPYDWLNDGNDIYIPMCDLWISLDMSSLDNPFFKVDEDIFEDGTTHLYSGQSCHPHVFSLEPGRWNNSLCFGDFYNTYKDALHTGDISLVVSIMVCFLSQANTSDEAGCTWPRLINPALEKVESNEEFYINHETDEEYAEWEYEDQPHYVFEHIKYIRPAGVKSHTRSLCTLSKRGQSGPIVDENSVVTGWDLQSDETEHLYIAFKDADLNELRAGIRIEESEILEELSAGIITEPFLRKIHAIIGENSSAPWFANERWSRILSDLESDGYTIDLGTLSKTHSPRQMFNPTGQAPAAPAMPTPQATNERVFTSIEEVLAHA